MIDSTNILALIISFLIGGLAGYIYFFGLWLTLLKLPKINNPGLLMISSLLLRNGFVMSVFYLIMLTASWQGLVTGLIGLTLMRLMLNRRYGPATA
ncbi:ATP synthase subunit I [Leucothrix arctica]|uniref:ATP synthase subunit I n=1 Tax=Leucothrix arctica TaxID=1481894 RepID=A0A317C8X7_9GAMM|nr:ATP synthase subunit I [Leucothrix arctica]PWQ93843.1 ATP synthase subunit I [Leucothrix arctica]